MKNSKLPPSYLRPRSIRHTGTAALVSLLILGLGVRQAAATQLCGAEASNLLDHWLMVNPLPLLVLKVLGVLLVLGAFAISAYLFLIPERDDAHREGVQVE